MATVIFEPEAFDQYNELPERIKARVIKILTRLAQWPDVSGAKPLHRELAGHFRIRTGDYRVQFRVEGTVVIIERVGHRDGFYGE